MTFTQIETRNGMIHLDGYSRNKTLKGALKDLAREVAKISEVEGRAISDNLTETAEMIATGMMNEPDAYYIEAEEVPCASRYKFLNGDTDDYSEENIKVQYAEGHWYLYIRFCAPKQETEEQEAAQAELETEKTASAPVADNTASTLTEEEIKFFTDTVARIKYSVNVRVPIEPMNHEQLTGTNKEALGICWAEDNGTGKPVPFRITIDEFFIHECFLAREDPCMKITPETLEEVIAHEIAHLHVWRHGKKHTELTERICRLIERGEAYWMEDSSAVPIQRAGTVILAAMQPQAENATAERGNTMYKEIRKIRASSLRALCIRQDWYTAGDNDEYGHLLYDLAQNKENLNTADIMEIAADIMAHSELDDNCTIESIAFEVARIADVFFVELCCDNATKQQERETLAAIRQMVEELGPQSYIATAFEGCFEDAENNIENDFCDSMNARWLHAKAQLNAANGTIEELKEQLAESQKDYEAAHAAAHEIADQKDAEIATLQGSGAFPKTISPTASR